MAESATEVQGSKSLSRIGKETAPVTLAVRCGQRHTHARHRLPGRPVVHREFFHGVSDSLRQGLRVGLG